MALDILERVYVEPWKLFTEGVNEGAWVFKLENRAFRSLQIFERVQCGRAHTRGGQWVGNT